MEFSIVVDHLTLIKVLASYLTRFLYVGYQISVFFFFSLPFFVSAHSLAFAKCFEGLIELSKASKGAVIAVDMAFLGFL